MYERYKILKSIYPDYLIIFKEKEKFKYKGIDQKIIDIFGLKKLENVNKIIIDNLDIVKIEKYHNNEYNLYYKKTELIEVLKEVIACEEE